MVKEEHIDHTNNICRYGINKSDKMVR